jgi:hypothetical protein
MSDMSAYLGDKLLNWMRGTAFGTAPTNVYAALWNGDPDGGGTEITGTINLTRQIVDWDTVAARALDNDAEVDFGTANSTGTATYVVLMDAVSSGNQLSKKAIASAGITSGEKVAIAVGALVLSY